MSEEFETEADAVLTLCQFMTSHEGDSPGHWNLVHNGTVRLARMAAARLSAAPFDVTDADLAWAGVITLPPEHP